MVRLIRKSAQQLVLMPESGRIGRVACTREVVVPGTPYLVAYRITEDSIQVLAVLHAARQWPEFF
jgi:toxin ParE1/3/4